MRSRERERDFLRAALALKFGSFDGEPFVYRPGEAWVVRDERQAANGDKSKPFSRMLPA
jgi:hypothetical protein